MTHIFDLSQVLLATETPGHHVQGGYLVCHSSAAWQANQPAFAIILTLPKPPPEFLLFPHV